MCAKWPGKSGSEGQHSKVLEYKAAEILMGICKIPS